MMEEEREGLDEVNESNGPREEIYSKAIRAGKRTYFFDVKATRSNDYYMTITESKKRFNNNGTFFFEKHKIFLYKEDFEKFNEALTDVIAFINNTADNIDSNPKKFSDSGSTYSNVDFDDLDNTEK